MGVRKDLKNTKIHCYWEMQALYLSNLSDADACADITSRDRSHCKVGENCKYIADAIRVKCHDSCDLANSPEARQWRTAREAIGRGTSGHGKSVTKYNLGL